MRWVQTNQIEELTDNKKSDMVRQCVKPQIRDHSNKVPASKDFNKSTGLSMSSVVWELRSRQTSHIRQPIPYSKPLKKNSPTNSSMQSAKRQLYYNHCYYIIIVITIIVNH